MTKPDIAQWRTWLTRQQAADRAGVSLRTIDRWRAEGRLPEARLRGRYVRIDPKRVDDLNQPHPN